MSVSQVNAVSPMDLSSLSPMAQAQAATGTTTSSSTGTGLTSTTAGTTFLNLLVQELQNQDPSAPMDSTAMVGQMISLNQLDQLVSINQDLGGSASSGTVGTGSTTAGITTNGQGGSSAALVAARAALLNSSTGAPSAAQAATLAASDPNSILQLSTLNNLYGAK